MMIPHRHLRGEARLHSKRAFAVDGFLIQPEGRAFFFNVTIYLGGEGVASRDCTQKDVFAVDGFFIQTQGWGKEPF